VADGCPVLAISDLHMGDGGPRDNFAVGGRPQQLALFLDHVRAEGGQLVIVGDLFEFWQASLSKVLVHNLPLLDRLAELQSTYVLGNHDADLADFIDHPLLAHPIFARMSGPCTRTIGRRRFRFMHGHEVDPFNASPNPSWGRMLAIFARIFEDRIGSPLMPTGESVEDVLDSFGQTVLRLWNWLAERLHPEVGNVKPSSPKDELTPAQNPARARQMLAHYAADRQAQGYDVAIVGHTHQPGRIGDWYFNTGSWATTNNNFVRIEPSGEVRVFDWVAGRAVPNETVLPFPDAKAPGGARGTPRVARSPA
jgi:UDP-2,3-diacylglucosamine pyrophosphatase LpxH